MTAPTMITCGGCGREVWYVSRSTGRCDQCRQANKPRRAHTVDPWLRFCDDAAAQAFVLERPDGATLEECAEAFGCTRENVRQHERRALTSFRKRLKLAGISESDALALFAREERSREMGGGHAAARPA